MTAPLVLYYSRKPVPVETLLQGGVDADHTAILFGATGVTLPAGQLWERTAEAAKAVAS